MNQAATIEAEAESRHMEDPLCALQIMEDDLRRALARAADLQTRRDAQAERVARGLRRARARGVEYVAFNDRIYFERDGELHSAPFARAHEVAFDPESADGRPWREDDVVGLGPAPVPLTYDPIRWEVANDDHGRVGGARELPGREDRSC